MRFLKGVHFLHPQQNISVSQGQWLYRMPCSKRVHAKSLWNYRAYFPAGVPSKTCKEKSKVTLLDLKNAFGEIDHSLITKTLGYHHVPQHVKEVINGLYNGFTTSIATGHFIIPEIKFEKVYSKEIA